MLQSSTCDGIKRSPQAGQGVFGMLIGVRNLNGVDSAEGLHQPFLTELLFALEDLGQPIGIEQDAGTGFDGDTLDGIAGAWEHAEGCSAGFAETNRVITG